MEPEPSVTAPFSPGKALRVNLMPRSGAARVASAVFVTVGALGIAGAPAATAGTGTGSPTAQAASNWLTAEMARNAGSMPGFSPGTPDVGLTEDVVLALTAAGDGTTTAARKATSAVATHVADFISYDTLGAGFKGVRLAGPMAKSLLVDEVQGGDPHAFGGWDLEGDLRALMVTSGASAGRFADKDAFSPDASNGFGQALGLLALKRTKDGIPADATAFLLAQQCPAGGFRLFYDTGSACGSNAEADTDATSLAVEALLVANQSSAVTTARARAVGWLLGVQDGTTGSFSGTGPTATPNANSTGLAAAVLRAAGETAAADAAAAYVGALQLASGADAGALAYDHAALVAATGGTIDDLSRDQWRRATAQAVLALGLPGYGGIVAVPAPSGGSGGGGPVVGGTSKATVSASSVTAGRTVRVRGGGFRPGESVQVWLHSTPVLLATAKASATGAVVVTVRVPARAATGSHRLVVLGVASGHQAVVAFSVTAAAPLPASAAGGGAPLPDTGAPTAWPASVGLSALLVGSLLIGIARRRPEVGG